MHDIDYRTELFRLRLPIYKVASEISTHPSRSLSEDSFLETKTATQ